MKLRNILFLNVCLLIASGIQAQTKAPRMFASREKSINIHIHKYVKYDTLIETSGANIHIHYSKSKDKPYLLMLHGMGIDAKTNWYRQIEALSRHYNLLMPDLLYFGKSVAKETNYSVEFQVQQIHEALAKLGIEGKINVMGFSYGGLTAAMYNQFYNSEVKKLIIIDGPVKYYSEHLADSMARVAGVPSMTNIIIPQSISDFKAMKKAVLSKKFPITKKFTLKFIDYFFTPTLPSRLAQLNYLTDHQATYQAYNYNLDATPTLLMWGARDGVVPICVATSLHKNFASTTRLILFKHAKHDVHFRYSKKINKEVCKFLSE